MFKSISSFTVGLSPDNHDGLKIFRHSSLPLEKQKHKPYCKGMRPVNRFFIAKINLINLRGEYDGLPLPALEFIESIATGTLARA